MTHLYNYRNIAFASTLINEHITSKCMEKIFLHIDNLHKCQPVKRVDSIESIVFELHKDDVKAITHIIKEKPVKPNKNTVVKKSKNRGEIDEKFTKEYIYELNDSMQYEKLVSIFGDEAREGVSVINFETNEVYTNVADAREKSKSVYKADVRLKMNLTGNVYNPSIKSKSGSHPAILNHTPRTGKVFNTTSGILKEQMASLDRLMTEYINKRKANIFKEDVSLTRLECLEDIQLRNDIIKVLSYFVFEGTGKGDSIIKADSLLYVKKEDITFIRCDTPESKYAYVNSIIEKCVISLRTKGMPKQLNEISRLWLYEDKSGTTVKYKGCFHVRVDIK
jgi:hypothetical protein